MPISLRSEQSSPLSWGQVDGNFSALDERTRLGWRDNFVELKVDSSSPNAPTLAILRGNIMSWQFFPNGPNDTLEEPVFSIFLDLHYKADHATTPNKAPPFL